MVGIIKNGEKLLLTRYAHSDYKNYSLVAGFMEIGETLEEAAKREVMEEVGLKVKNLRYYKSQPWAFSESILVGFFADAEGNTEPFPMEKSFRKLFGFPETRFLLVILRSA